MTTLTPSQDGRPKLTLATQLLHSSGAIANSMKQTGLSMLLLLFYNQVVGLDPRLVSTVIMITLIFDAVVDPLIGQLSDNLRSRYGRRHPFMYAAAVPVALAFFAIWNPPAGLSDSALFVYMLTCLLAIRLFDTFYELPASALTPELTSDYNKRTTLISFRSFFNIFGRFITTIAIYQVFMRQMEDGSGGVTSRDGYFAYSVTAAIVIAVIILIAAASTHRFIPYLSTPQKREKGASLGEMASEVLQSLSNRSFLAMAVAGIVLAVGTGLRQGLDVYFGLFYWGFSQTQLTLMVTASMLTSTLGIIVLAPYLGRRFGKKTSAMIMGWTGITLSCTPLVLDQAGLLPARGDPSLFYSVWAFEFITPAFMTGTGVMISAMIADCVEDVAVKTGKRSEGLLFSADNLFKKAVSGLGVLIAGQVLHLANFPENAREVGVDPSALNALAWIFVACLIFLNGGCLTSMMFYRITKEQHEENVRKLAQMNAAASGAAAQAPASAPTTPIPGGARERPSEA